MDQSTKRRELSRLESHTSLIMRDRESEARSDKSTLEIRAVRKLEAMQL